jgi:hypothetical protein
MSQCLMKFSPNKRCPHQTFASGVDDWELAGRLGEPARLYCRSHMMLIYMRTAPAGVFGLEPKLFELILCVTFAIGTLLKYSDDRSLFWLAITIPVIARSLECFTENIYLNGTCIGNLLVWWRLHNISLCAEVVSVAIVAMLTVFTPSFTATVLAGVGIGPVLAEFVRGICGACLLFYLGYRLGRLLGMTMLEPPEWPFGVLWVAAIMCALSPLLLWLGRLDAQRDAMWDVLVGRGHRWARYFLGLVPTAAMWFALWRVVRIEERRRRGRWIWRRGRLYLFQIWFWITFPGLVELCALMIACRVGGGRVPVFLMVGIPAGMWITVVIFRRSFPSLIQRLDGEGDASSLAHAMRAEFGTY